MTHSDPAHSLALLAHDALLVVDLQNDFLSGGALPVTPAERIVPVVNAYIEQFVQNGLPVFLTRDWHCADHHSFAKFGGSWPIHCVAGSKGAQFAAALTIPEQAVIVSKGIAPDQDGYSAFENSDLNRGLHDKRIERLFVGGLATDYCVLHTVLDALKAGYAVYVLQDAIAAVNVQPNDGAESITAMQTHGARLVTRGKNDDA